MRDSDFCWLNEHAPELYRKYAGKWIAVRDGKVIGVGETATDAADEARREVPGGDFILEGVDVAADVIYGCPQVA